MSSRLSVSLLSLLTAVTVCAGDEPSMPSESFVAAQFTNVPAPSQLVMSTEISKSVQEILGHRYGKHDLYYWRLEGKTVWVLETVGRSNSIMAGFVIRDGMIEKAEILVYREMRGEQVKTKAFLRQFIKAGLAGDGRLDRRIDGITGATISVNAIKNLARLALYLEKKSSGNSHVD